MGLHQPHIKKRIYKIILCHCVDVAHHKSTEILTQVPGIPKKALVQIKLCVCVVGKLVHGKKEPNICSGFAMI